VLNLRGLLIRDLLYQIPVPLSPAIPFHQATYF